MGRLQELETLKRRARRMEDRLRALNRRLEGMERRGVRGLFRPVVLIDRCKGCGTCETVCPTGAVEVHTTAQIDESRCIGCGRCADACPVAAISLERSQPGEAVRISGVS